MKVEIGKDRWFKIEISFKGMKPQKLTIAAAKELRNLLDENIKKADQ